MYLFVSKTFFETCPWPPLASPSLLIRDGIEPIGTARVYLALVVGMRIPVTTIR